MDVCTPTPKRPHYAVVIAMATALLLAFSSVAAADEVLNDIVDEGQTAPTIDAVAEILDVVAGANATTVTLSVRATSEENGNNICNLEGAGPNGLVLDIVNSHPAVATVVGPDAANPNLLTFTDCDSGAYTQTLTVTGVLPGTANITFALNPLTSASATAGQRTWTFTTASFNVVVAPGSTVVPGTYCDDPAAPAWANHILKANQKKKKLSDRTVTNYVAQVAHQMGPGTDFNSITKTTHPDYEQAVELFLEQRMGVTLNPATGWPPLSCTTTTAL